jgi:TPP-dependent pyruvate/acetoin dehydrogenase alpha subunit
MTAAAASARLDGDQLVACLRQMMLMRCFDEAAMRLVQAGEIRGVVHPYFGQEASAAGIAAALEPGDRVASTHRGHGHCIAAGVDLGAMMAELFGRSGGVCKGKGGSMHVADLGAGMLGANGIVAAGVPIAVGAALSEQLDGGDRVVVAYFGDGASGQGVLFESLNLAALWRLPVLFVCENNSIASATPTRDTIAVERVADLATGHGVRAERVDGQDVDAVYSAAAGAVAALRAGEGPRMIEAMVCRFGTHASRAEPFPDARDPALLAAERERDPIALLRARLADSGVLTSGAAEEIHAGTLRAVEDAIAFARTSPYPALAEAETDVFS